MSGHDDGFTLIETLTALVILALAASTFYRALETGTQGARIAERETAALALAQSRLDEVVALGPQENLALKGQTPDGYAWSTTVSGLDRTRTDRSPVGLARVDVRVSWRDGPARRERDLTLTTIMASRSR
jgi:type II secretion system protein I